LISSFPIFIPFIPFSCFIILGKNLNTTINKRVVRVNTLV
jgi:hypothetical protein